MADQPSDPPELSETEREALHEVELGVENLHRAHGHLVSFHHSTGRAMDHLDDAETLLREAGHGSLADALRDEYLPRGVFGHAPEGVEDVAAGGTDERSGDNARPEGRWTYELLENYQVSFLSDFVAFGDRVHESLAGGRRHVKEREQQREWAERAEHE